MSKILPKIISIILCICMVLFSTTNSWALTRDKSNLAGGLNLSHSTDFARNSITNEDEIWQKTVQEYLEDDLWIEQNMYDAGHYLMVPLHAAFRLDREQWQSDFSLHFYRFVEVVKHDPAKLSKNQLDKLQYLYLASQFVVLCEKYGKENLIPEGLVSILQDEVEKVWKSDLLWPWAEYKYNFMAKQRIDWKLATKSKTYYSAIIDAELFLFAIAADLRFIERSNKPQVEWSPTIDAILEITYKVFKSRSVFKGEGWLFQPGTWWDHPDYAYAGHSVIKPNLKPKPIYGIAIDTSHSHRFPLWLISFKNAYDLNTKEYVFYQKVLTALEKQFFNKVLIKPTVKINGYLTNNYMDGRNGVYRYGYKTQGKNNGYGPYELSGTLNLGWWTFLESIRIKNIYQEITKSLPLTKEVIKYYFGPNTTRKQHPLIIKPDFYHNDFLKLILKFSGSIQ